MAVGPAVEDSETSAGFLEEVRIRGIIVMVLPFIRSERLQALASAGSLVVRF